MDSSVDFDRIRLAFEKESGLADVEYDIIEREEKSILVLKIASPSERFFKILNDVLQEYKEQDADLPLVTLKKKSTSNLLRSSEGKLLLKTLAESLNINRYSFQSDFLSRYTESVTGAEEKIVADANHVVFGRRGAGKSTLLLYALHTRNNDKRPSVWLDMQVYARREDDSVIADVLSDMLFQVTRYVGDHHEYAVILEALKEPALSESKIRILLPVLRRLLSYFASNGLELFIFLDDYHVLADSLQPRLLDVLYAISRGNKLFIKISSIETFTRTFDTSSRQGLEIPHDAQIITLDYNLTIPNLATKHIEAILNAHAIYCGLPSVRRLCTSSDVVPRLTWVAAGVPRDALNLFSQAISKATINSRSLVSVSDVNMAASETINTKLKEIEKDASGQASSLRILLEAMKEFCIKNHKKNAFLVEIMTDNAVYLNIRNLIDLRLLHVISEGITRDEAGRKYLGLILDYGFYIGVRAARSVDLFNKQTGRVVYKDLRLLPVFDYASK